MARANGTREKVKWDDCPSEIDSDSALSPQGTVRATPEVAASRVDVRRPAWKSWMKEERELDVTSRREKASLRTDRFLPSI